MHDDGRDIAKPGEWLRGLLATAALASDDEPPVELECHLLNAYPISAPRGGPPRYCETN